jgi:alanyl-tRNA synthetase
LRKEPVREGLLRLIEIADFDLSACGGTHAATTGQVGFLAVSAWERFKGGTRLTFACGQRGLRAFRDLRDTTDAAARLLSVAGADIPRALQRVQHASRDLERRVAMLDERLSMYRAAELRGQAEPVAGHHFVVHVDPEGGPAALKMLAQNLVASPGVVVLLAGGGTPTPVVFARASDVQIDSGRIIAAAVKRLGGRGGGRPELAQGGLPAAPEAIIACVRELLRTGTA